MDDDERERLAHSVENMMGYSGGKPVNGRKIAAQLRADGERIKVLEAALRPFAKAGELFNGLRAIQRKLVEQKPPAEGK